MRGGAPRVLIFDTETTGMVQWRRPEDDPGQPHLIQLGMVLAETRHWESVSQHCLLVRLPETASIETGAFRAHGISKEKCQTFGVSLSVACELFRALAERADCIVAHNLRFDRVVITASLLRAGQATDWLSERRWLCSMEASTPVLRLPSGRNDYKWPTLGEAYEHFTGELLRGAHDALVDSQACLAVLRGLVEKGAVSL